MGDFGMSKFNKTVIASIIALTGRRVGVGAVRNMPHGLDNYSYSLKLEKCTGRKSDRKRGRADRWR